jgi:hypothetical protein
LLLGAFVNAAFSEVGSGTFFWGGDMLRDFLPAALGLQPTVRLYAREYPWCKLNLDNSEDVETLRRILSHRGKL